MSIAEQLFIDGLRRSQWQSPAELWRKQQRLLDRLLRHAATHTDYYPERLAPLFAGGDPAYAPIDWSRWQEIPVVRRVEAVDLFQQLKAREVPPEAGESREGRSGGSTGRPFEHLRSEANDSAANCMIDRVCELYGIDLFAPLAFMVVDPEQKFPYPHGGKYKGWNRTAPDATLFVLDTATPVDAQLEWLERVRPDYVMTYPYLLAEIATHAIEKKSALKLKGFLSSGETLDQWARSRIAEAFGCASIDLYAAREIGQIAFECPEADGYHVCAEAVLLELLDDSDRPVEPGEYGRVVVTPLYNYAMPLIRYDVDDYAQLSGEACRCGRGLPHLSHVSGRTRNLMLMANGTRRGSSNGWATAISKFLSFRRLQVVQTGFNAVEIRFEPGDPDEPPDTAGLHAYFSELFETTADVRLVPVERLERGPGMKMEQFICRVP
jgi:phenylacetate-CoA ligase